MTNSWAERAIYRQGKDLCLHAIKIRIEALVTKHGSYRAAGEAVGIDHAYLQRLWEGEKTNPSEAVLQKLGLVEQEDK